MSSALALRNAFGDVEQDDVAELLQADEVGERAADLPRADKRDLLASHGTMVPWGKRGAAGRRAPLL